MGLLGYRQSKLAGSALRTLWVDSGASYGGSFDYAAWQRAQHADEPTPLSTPCRGATVVLLPGPGDAAVTHASLEAQHRPCDRLVDASHAAGDGLEALAAAIDDAPEGHFVLALCAGDRLEPDALTRILDRVEADPRAAVVTWDDDHPAPGGRVPRFRPVTFSPDTLLSCFPFARSIAVRADAARSAGGLDAALGVDAMWDLVLRVWPTEQQAVHVPLVLAHLASRPPAVGRDGAAVVQAHLDRLGLSGSTELRHGAVRVRWRPEQRSRVSIVVPTRHDEALMGPLLDSLRATDHPDWELVVVDNAQQTDARQRFWDERAEGLDLTVLWWDRPFNYSEVNNVAAGVASGDVLVLLNDDTVVRSPEWLDELTGWLGVPGVGSVGVQLRDPEGLIQHGGAIIGAAGLADHRFQGLPPHSDTLLGSTDWYWDSSANTAACVAVRKELWEEIGGLDERFVLCGSDVVLGLDLRRRGMRNVCTPAIHVDHWESATRQRSVPVGDVFASYWRYARFLRGGDPYHNPNVSLMSRAPALRAPDEPTALERVGPSLGRAFGGAFVQSASTAEAKLFAGSCRADDDTAAAIARLHSEHGGAIDVSTINWYVPAFDNPFYGGLATIFRIADHLRRHHDVSNRFVVWGDPNEQWFRSGIAAVFPGLESSEVLFTSGLEPEAVSGVPACDVSIATQWQTAYQVAHAPRTLRKAYLVQDFEPGFNPAGTLYALAEETYRLGLFHLCNTPRLLDLVRARYGGAGAAFMPAVDGSVFHPDGRRERGPDEPLNIFVYARPGHWRNCWELAEPALREVKRRYGAKVRIVTAGAWSAPNELCDGFDHLGLLDYAETGPLYRTCDIGVSLTVSEHPSYLPLELGACGVPVVAFPPPRAAGSPFDGEGAILRDGVSCRVAKRTVDGLVERLVELIEDEGLRDRLGRGALELISEQHRSWEANLSGVHAALSGPFPRSGDANSGPFPGAN